MIVDPAEMLARFFPRAMLNLDAAPPGMTIGPIHAILRQVGQVIANFQADALLSQAQLSVQQAAGPYLDSHGLFYSVARRPGETDEPYRARILLAITAGKLTIPAIAAVVQAYYATATYPHVITVFDRQSNPSAAAAVVYTDPTGTIVDGLVKLDIAIDIHTEIPASLVFFAGRSYAGRNSYVISTAPNTTIAPSDPELVADIVRTKAGGAFPVYIFQRDIQAHV